MGRRACALAAFGVAGTSMAQFVGRDFIASPGVYKVVAENDQYRIVEGTWKPGQRDQIHSHPAMLWYWTTDCSIRFHQPDGMSRPLAADRSVRSGVGTQRWRATGVENGAGVAPCDGPLHQRQGGQHEVS